MIDWSAEIEKCIRIHAFMREMDREKIWTYYYSQPPAQEQQICDTESRLGFTLDPQYREFLLRADGWKSFYQDVYLFGWEQLLGTDPMDRARQQMDAIGEEMLSEILGGSSSDFYPIAASSVEIDIFLLRRAAEPGHTGEVVWIAGSLVDKFPCFEEYFLAMLDYNRLNFEFLMKRHNPQRPAEQPVVKV